MFDAQEMRAPGLPADTAPAVPLPPTGQPSHLLDRLNAVFKHRRIAGAVFVLVLGAMMIQSYSTMPMYETSARVEIKDERSTGAARIGINDPTSYQEVEAYYQTQYQVIQSREVGRRVVRKLKLAEHPMFNGRAARPHDPVSLLRDARSKAGGWIRALVAKETPPSEAPMPQDPVARENAIIASVMSHVQVQPVKDTMLVNIVYRHNDPQFSAAAVNAIAEEYAAQNLENRYLSTSSRMEYLDGELQNASKRANDAETALAKYRAENNAQSLEPGNNVIGTKYNDLNNQLVKADAELLTAKGRWDQVARVDPAQDAADTVGPIGSDEDVVTARTALASLLQERQQQTLKGRGPGHPEMQKLELQISSAKESLVAARVRAKARYQAAYESAQNTRNQIAASLRASTDDLSDLDKKRATYAALQREASAAQDSHKQLLEQYQTLKIAANSKENNVKVVDYADVPGVPYTPDTKKDLITAILAGLTLAIGLAFGIEYLDDSVKTPEDVTKRLRLPLLGLVPAVRGERVPVLTETVPHDFGEAFRSLRTSLVFTSGGEHTRIIAVTSSQPLEGKTTTACNLALALALGGSRVLLIDADMRRPGLHKTMGLQNGLGLSHLLTGQSRVREVVQRTREPNLFVITAGRTPPNPSELLASERLDQFLANLQGGPFDWVVVDTPPVLAVTDAVILAQKIGSVVFVIGSEMTRRAHAERALETLRTSKAKNIGAVLNRVDFDRNKYYYARYYGYQYKSYYGQNNTPA
jgi:polysaccharide biosynthesis transport protein